MFCDVFLAVGDGAIFRESVVVSGGRGGGGGGGCWGLCLLLGHVVCCGLFFFFCVVLVEGLKGVLRAVSLGSLLFFSFGR